jgi:hypothetical protein
MPNVIAIEGKNQLLTTQSAQSHTAWKKHKPSLQATGRVAVNSPVITNGLKKWLDAFLRIPLLLRYEYCSNNRGRLQYFFL